MKTKLFPAVLLVAAVAADPAVAQVYRLRVVSPSCQGAACRLEESFASAVVIGRYRPGKEILLTAGHAVRGPVRRVELDVDGQWRAAAVLAVAKEPVDLALVGVELSGALPCVPVAESVPRPGTHVWLVGHPQGGAQRRRQARVESHPYADVDFVTTGAAQPGESGGGVFDGDGRLVGVLFGTAPAGRPTHTLVTGAERIRQFLRATYRADPPPCGSSAEPHEDRLREEVAALTRRVVELEAELARVRSPPPPAATVLPDEFARLTERVRQIEGIQIPVEILAPDGQVIDRQRYALGQPIQLRLVPKRE